MAAEKIFSQFETYNVEKCLITYNTYIFAIARKMKDEVLKIGKQKWTRQSRIELAEEMFSNIELSGLKPDRRTINSLLAVYARGDFQEKALKIFHEYFVRYDQVQDYWTFSHMIWSSITANDLRAALMYFSQMKALNIEPDQMIYSGLLRLCRKTEDTFAGIAVLREMAQKGMEANRMDASPFKHLIHDPQDKEALVVRYHKYSEIQLVAPRHQKAIEQAEVLREELLAGPNTTVNRALQHSNWGNDAKFHPLNPYFAENVAQAKTMKADEIQFHRERAAMAKKAWMLSQKKRYRL